jgi:hypothetical protein
MMRCGSAMSVIPEAIGEAWSTSILGWFCDLLAGLATYLSAEGLLIMVVVGVAAGWLADQILQETGFGLLGDLFIRVIGAFIGDWLMPWLLEHQVG